MRDRDSLATILLVSRLCAEGLQPLKASEYWRLLDRLGDGSTAGEENGGKAHLGGPRRGPGVLLDRGGSDALAEDLADRIGALTDRATAIAFELDRLEQSGIRTLTAFDEHYPKHWRNRLEAKAPPLLHCAGALELLDRPGLGVVGSRDVSQEGADVAREIARLAARRKLPLVSGGARGVDQLAMDAALEAGGAVVGILAESLTRKLKRPDVRRAIYDGTTVMCTPYSPDTPFSAGNAMGRNKLIYAQAALTVVVASDDGSGGTWSGAVEALKGGYGRVAIWRGDGEGPGNAVLQQRGATAVRNLDEIESMLDDEPEPPAVTAETSEQPTLFAAAAR